VGSPGLWFEGFRAFVVVEGDEFRDPAFRDVVVAAFEDNGGDNEAALKR
jgi:hypothetical protein